jgi:exopolysaccharide biosynthesis WecB/TagA/CpsF family protein
MLRRLLARGAMRTQWVCFLNSHSFNIAMLDGECRHGLSAAHAVFPDGCAMHVAARLCGLPISHNLPGTDLVPALLESCSGKCFMIGDGPEWIKSAAREFERRFPRWSVVGFAPGYFGSEEEERRVIDLVNRAKPDLLLIGMGTPLQERFVLRYADDLRVPLCICVGGLFSYWNGRLIRAPRLMRRLRLEWLWILAQQPHKLGRYTIGIARFFATALRHRWRGSSGP